MEQSHFETVFRIRHADGHWIEACDRGFVIRDKDGFPIRVVGSTQDVTERRRLERELEENNRRLKFQGDILEATNDAVIAVDARGCVTYCNAGAERMYRVEGSSVVGKPLSAIHTETWPNPEDEQRASSDLANLGHWNGENIHLRRDGTQIFVSSTVNVLSEDSGSGTVAVIRDISALKKAELESRRHAAELARANEDLLHFAYAVSHDLQAPLRTVTSFSQLLALKYRAKLDEEGSSFIKLIVEASTRMSAMIRDLLELAKAAGSEIALEEEVALEESLAYALANLRSLVSETDAEIIHDRLPIVSGNAGQITQLFQNLVGNSIKYRKPGVSPKIHIAAERHGAEWVIVVRDNGLGFESKHAERIFGVFQRLHGAEYSGTGVGLAICKRIVERRGGRIWASGTQNQGAEFSFSIPDGMPQARVTRETSIIASEPLLFEAPVVGAPFDELFHTLDLAQCIVRDLNGTILIWTQGAERLFGWTKSEAIGQHIHKLLKTEFPRPQPELEAELLRTGEWKGRIKKVKRDGTALWLASHWALYRDGSGRPQSVIEVNNDVTALKDVEDALRRSTEQRDLALRAGGMGVWQWDIRSDSVVWDDTVEGFLGLAPGSFERNLEAFRERIHPDDRAAVEDRIREAFETGPDYSVEHRIRHTSGHYCWWRGQGRVLVEAGQPAGMQGVVWDITVRKQAELDREFLLTLSARLTTTSIPAELIAITVHELGRYLDVPRCTYSENDWTTRQITVLGDYSPSALPTLGHYAIDALGGLTSELGSAGVVAVADTETDPLTADQYETTYLPLKTRSLLYVALYREGVWRAQVGISDEGLRDWAARDKTLLRGVAERLWPALENARLLQTTREKQEQFEGTFEQAAVGMAHVALDGRWLRVNRSVSRITGYTAQELLAGRLQDIIHPDDLLADQEQFEALQRNDMQSYCLEMRINHKTGSTVWVNLTVALIRDNSGEPKYAISVLEDITSRRKTSQDLEITTQLAALRLREIEAADDKLKIATSIARIGVYTWDVPEDRATWENDWMYEIMGRRREDGPANSADFFEKFIFPEDSATFQKDLSEAMRSGQPYRSSCRIKRQTDSVVRTVEFACQFELAPDGSPLRLVGVVADITDRVEAERTLQDRKRFLLNVLDSLYTFVGLMSADGVLLEVNRAPLEAADVRADAVVGKYLPDSTWWSYSPAVQSRLWDAIRKAQAGESSRFDIQARMKNGQLVTLDWTISPLRDESGEIRYLMSSAVPIEEQKQTENALRKSEERYLLAEWATNDGLWDWTPSTDYCYFSPRFNALLGLEEGELEDRAAVFFTRLHPEDEPRIHAAVRLHFEERHTFDVEFRVLRKQGDYRWFRSRGQALRDPLGNVIRMVGSMGDIHDRKQAESLSHEQDEQLRSMIDSIAQLAWIAKADGYIFWYNRRWYEYTGTTAEQMEGWGWQSVHDPEVLPFVMERWTASIRTGVPFDMVFPLRGVDGVYRSFLTRVVPLRDTHGNIVRWFGTNTNIDALRKEQDLLKESARQFRELAEALPEMMWAADPKGRITYWNPQVYAYTGMSEGTGIGETGVSIVHPEDAARLEHVLRESVATGQHYEYESRIRRHDGAYRWFLHRAESVRDENGRIIKWLGTSTDIHEQKLTEQALRRSNEDLEQFAYAASHDLQEPLRTVSIYSQLLSEQCGGHNQESKMFARYVVDSAKQMDSLLKGILAYSRAGDWAETFAPSDSTLALRHALRNLAPLIEESGTSITHGDLPVALFPEPQLVQLFQNLLGNAIKYRSTASPRIHISAERDGRWLKFAVADNGIGIQNEYLEQIFGVFKRLHKDEYPGVGIGLAICKRIVERQGGRIWAESELGKGTRIYFTLLAPEKE